MRIKNIPFLVKATALQVLFLILYYLYDFFSNNLIRLISGIDEIVYQHMKIGFFAYVTLVIIEYLINRKNKNSTKNSFTQALFSFLLSPGDDGDISIGSYGFRAIPDYFDGDHFCKYCTAADIPFCIYHREACRRRSTFIGIQDRCHSLILCIIVSIYYFHNLTSLV